jgi:ABC-type uncharacterized transport system permease subunit
LALEDLSVFNVGTATAWKEIDSKLEYDYLQHGIYSGPIMPIAFFPQISLLAPSSSSTDRECQIMLLQMKG